MRMVRAKILLLFGTGVFTLFLAIAPDASAGTVDPWFDTTRARPVILHDVKSPAYNELLNILNTHFISSAPFGNLPRAVELLFQTVLLFTGLIVCMRRRVFSRPYVALAALLASLRILSIIARKPFERWADKWSFNPSRPSSAAASTLRTSDAVKPL